MEMPVALSTAQALPVWKKGPMLPRVHAGVLFRQSRSETAVAPRLESAACAQE